MLEPGARETVPEVLDGFTLGIEAGFFDAHLRQQRPNPVAQLAVALELIVGRIQLDFTAQRFLDIYNEFIQGVKLQPESTLQELAANYCEADQNYFGAFVAEHEYVWENFLVSHAYKTLFPFGQISVNATMPATSPAGLFIEENYLLLMAYYSVTRTLAVGVAGHRGGDFGVADATRIIQACSRTLEHCTRYPKFILQLLESRGLRSAARAAILIPEKLSARQALRARQV